MTTSPTRVLAAALDAQRAPTLRPTNVTATIAPVVVSTLPPLVARAPVGPLHVDGHLDAVVAVPVGATSPRPIVVAAHGRVDRPDPLCFALRSAIGSRGFVVCPRGALVAEKGVTADDPRAHFTFDDADALSDEITDDLGALRARFGAYVDRGPVTYVGFSLGAYLGVAVVRRSPRTFPRALFIEGGHDPWGAAASTAFLRDGGERVFFACGTSACDRAAGEAIDALEGAGVLTRLLYAEGSGHVYAGPVGEEIADAFDALVDEDPRWATE
ncbi:MAG: hypothetical protein ACHREM_17985 [Polyangiales bacterium]